MALFDAGHMTDPKSPALVLGQLALERANRLLIEAEERADADEKDALAHAWIMLADSAARVAEAEAKAF